MIFTSIESITPEIAASMLALNTDNRRIGLTIVDQYADDMLHGRWKLTGQPIIIDKDGYLLDGQHRLSAVIKSGACVTMMIVRGVERHTRDSIDIGKVRRSGDVVQMFHVPNGTAVAALAAIVMGWERAGLLNLGSRSRVSKTEIIDRCRTDERLVMADRVAGRSPSFAPRKAVAFARYVIPDSANATMFFERFADGAALDAGSPILAVRNWFLRNGKRVPDNAACEALLRAWCAVRDQRQLHHIKIIGEFPAL